MTTSSNMSVVVFVIGAVVTIGSVVFLAKGKNLDMKLNINKQQ